jgi:hypothetical protein
MLQGRQAGKPTGHGDKTARQGYQGVTIPPAQRCVDTLSPILSS